MGRRQMGLAVNWEHRLMSFRVAIALLFICTTLMVAGCDGVGGNSGRLEQVWGRRGLTNGRLRKPRAMAIKIGRAHV